MKILPEWVYSLNDEDIAFIKKFVIASGSLKEIADTYGVTYPTVRLRLDRLIQKIRISEDTNNDDYIATVKKLALDEKISIDAARILIAEYKKTKSRDGY